VGIGSRLAPLGFVVANDGASYYEREENNRLPVSEIEERNNGENQ
jgi:hypothetical protein